MFEQPPKEEKKGESVRVAPEVEAAIEGEPVSDKLKRQRLAGEMLKAWREQHPGEEIPDVEIIESDEQAA